MARSSRRSPPPAVAPDDASAPRVIGHPIFAQAVPTPDPTIFAVKHASDTQAYNELDALRRAHQLFALPFPKPRGLPEPKLTLQQVLGDDAATIARINDWGQIVFHAGGDCGSTRSPEHQNEVTDKLLSDFNEAD